MLNAAYPSNFRWNNLWIRMMATLSLHFSLHFYFTLGRRPPPTNSSIIRRIVLKSTIMPPGAELTQRWTPPRARQKSNSISCGTASNTSVRYTKWRLPEAWRFQQKLRTLLLSCPLQHGQKLKGRDAQVINRFYRIDGHDLLKIWDRDPSAKPSTTAVKHDPEIDSEVKSTKFNNKPYLMGSSVDLVKNAGAIDVEFSLSPDGTNAGLSFSWRRVLEEALNAKKSFRTCTQ